MGKWYEIARLPNRFEQGLKCVTATYELRDDGKVNVFNRGIDEQNPERVDEAKGKARMPDPTFPGRLKVSFFWPFSGDYFIIDLDDDYTLSLVGDPGRKYLWILARSPEPEQDSIDELVKKAASLGFPVELLHYPPHDCM